MDEILRFIHSGFFKKTYWNLDRADRKISSKEVIKAGVSIDDVQLYGMWLEHEPLPLVSYPYEWSFESLKEAAILTLTLLVDGLKKRPYIKGWISI